MKMEPLMRTLTALAVIGTALLCTGEARAQSSGGGLSNLFGNIFSGPKPGAPAPPPAHPAPPRRTISRESFERFTAGLTPDLRIMDLMDSQPEFSKSIWDYLDILVNDNRLAKGREILTKYKAQFDATEKAYGVDRYAIAAIWGIESNYSTQMGDRSVLQSTATLSCIGRRQKYFRDEFLSALEILHHGDLRPEQMGGSWAGASGPT